MALGVPLNGAGLVPTAPSTPSAARTGLSAGRPPTQAHLGHTRAPAGFNRQMGMGRPDRSAAGMRPPQAPTRFPTPGALPPATPPATPGMGMRSTPPMYPQSNGTAPTQTPPSIGQANSVGAQPPSAQAAPPSIPEIGGIPAGATKMSYGAYGAPPDNSGTAMGKYIMQGLGI